MSSREKNRSPSPDLKVVTEEDEVFNALKDLNGERIDTNQSLNIDGDKNETIPDFGLDESKVSLTQKQHEESKVIDTQKVDLFGFDELAEEEQEDK